MLYDDKKPRTLINWIINPVSVFTVVALCHVFYGRAPWNEPSPRPSPLALLKGAPAPAPLLEVASRIENGRVVRVLAAVDGHDRIQKIVFTGLGDDQAFTLEQLRQDTAVPSPPGVL